METNSTGSVQIACSVSLLILPSSNSYSQFVIEEDLQLMIGKPRDEL